jgi:hypothetical protein
LLPCAYPQEFPVLKKLLGWLLLAFLLMYLVTDPTGAANAIRTVLTSAGQFVSALTGGGR